MPCNLKERVSSCFVSIFSQGNYEKVIVSFCFFVRFSRPFLKKTVLLLNITLCKYSGDKHYLNADEIKMYINLII